VFYNSTVIVTMVRFKVKPKRGKSHHPRQPYRDDKKEAKDEKAKDWGDKYE
jgi:hypothetical protein